MSRRRITDVEKKIMQDIAYNLKSILVRKGLTQKDLSEMTGLSTSAISDYINAKTLMAPNIIQIVAESLEVPAGSISPSLKPVDISNYEPQMVKLPIVGRISCGTGALAFENVEGYEDTPKAWLNGGEHFYLRAKGDSMINARIHDGDLLLIRKQPEVENGEIAAILIDEEAVLKRVYKNGDSMVLQSENPTYPPIVCSQKNVEILGKLKKIVISL
ncbi:transcriptional repressor LexA [Brevibacillus borstelensis]|uniref:transcriptional repressor LexA n=1 Tax=Brevibacillus borstelensis TaxID=45462 RepID=UPI0030C6263F